MSLEYVLDELPLSQAFALAAWNLEQNPWCRMKRVRTGYIGQELERAGM